MQQGDSYENGAFELSKQPSGNSEAIVGDQLKQLKASRDYIRAAIR